MEASTLKRLFIAGLALFVISTATASALFTTGPNVGSGGGISSARWFFNSGFFAFGRVDTGAQTVFTFTVPSTFSTADIDQFATIASVTLPAGDYALDFNAQVFNNTGANGFGSQNAIKGDTAPLTSTTDATMVTGPNQWDMSGMLGCTDGTADADCLPLNSMPFDANPHGQHSEHVTGAVWNNPVTQTVSWMASTNTTCTIAAGSTITLTKQ